MQHTKRMKITLRHVEPEDLDAFIRIERGAFPVGLRWDAKVWSKLLSEPKRHGIVVAARRRDNAAIGYLVFGCVDDLIQVVNLAVDTRYRRLGIATALLDSIITIEDKTWTRVGVIVHEENLAAQWFYRACGFRCTTIRWGYYAERDGYEFHRGLT